MTPERFEKARADLSRAVHAFADLSCRAIGLEWLGVPGLPEPVNLTDLIGSTKDGRLRVSEDHCKNTIFLDPYDNVAFRAWHDALHIQSGKGFDRFSEECVATMRKQQVALLGFNHDVQELVFADVAFQAQYYDEHGCFPHDQLEYMRYALTGS